MKYFLLALTILLISIYSHGQQIISGDYGSGLRLSYDSLANLLTGFYEDHTGWDEETKTPRFSCTFYIEGLVTGPRFKIKTYYPTDKSDDLVEGTMEIINNRTFTITLPEEHGGCWNVQHFADEPVTFALEKQTNWTQIRYIDTDSTCLYKDKLTGKKSKACLIKGDLVFIEKFDNNRAYCIYYGKKMTAGWITMRDLNKN